MKKLHPTAAQLLADIEAYRARVGINPTTFGREAAGDGHFITRVRSGKIPRLTTIDRIYRYMDRATKATRKVAPRTVPLLLLAVLALPALAQTPPEIWRPEPPEAPVIYLTPRIPTEEEKIWALKRAYQLNGNSMVGATIDLSREVPFARVIGTEKVTPPPPPPPLPAPRPKAEATEPSDLSMVNLRRLSRRANLKLDICARHGLRKTTTHNGKSWRCR
jgi:hypothetical protein